MKEQKHIDRLFQEKLKDFEATPSNAVWENINTELHSDNKARKIIPLWIRLSGIAVALLLLFTIGKSVFNTINENPEQDTIVDTNNSSNTDINEINTVSKDDIIDLNNNILETEHIVAEGSENKLKTEPLSNASKTTEVTDNSSYASKNALVNSKQNTSNILKDDNPVNQNLKTTGESTKTAVVQNNTGISKNKKSITSNTLEKADTKNVKSNAVVQNTKSDPVIDKNKTIENAVAKTVLDETNNSGDNIEDTTEKETIGADEKTSIEDAIVDNLKVANVKQDEKKKKNKIEDRWKVSPSIAPVYFNTLGAGSSIHEQFNQNTKTGDVNMSYGVRESMTQHLRY